MFAEAQEEETCRKGLCKDASCANKFHEEAGLNMATINVHEMPF